MPDALNSGVFPAAGDPSLYASTAPLAAGAQFSSPWLDVSGSGDAPYFEIRVASDMSGTLLVYQSEAESLANDVIGGTVVPASPIAGQPTAPRAALGIVNKRYLKFVYTNGSAPQTVFNIQLTVAANPALVPNLGLLDTRRLLELILRELRAQSMILAAFKEPGPLTLNLPYGPAPFTL